MSWRRRASRARPGTQSAGDARAWGGYRRRTSLAFLAGGLSEQGQGGWGSLPAHVELGQPALDLGQVENGDRSVGMAACDVEAVRAEDRLTHVVRIRDQEPRLVVPLLHQRERPAEVGETGKPPDCARPEDHGLRIDVAQCFTCAHVHKRRWKHLNALALVVGPAQQEAAARVDLACGAVNLRRIRDGPQLPPRRAVEGLERPGDASSRGAAEALFHEDRAVRSDRGGEDVNVEVVDLPDDLNTVRDRQPPEAEDARVVLGVVSGRRWDPSRLRLATKQTEPVEALEGQRVAEAYGQRPPPEHGSRLDVPEGRPLAGGEGEPAAVGAEGQAGVVG